MTTWTTFETIDETARFTDFYVDRLGVHQYHYDDRVRFEFTRHKGEWVVVDNERPEGLSPAHQGSMREVIQWVAGRILYGA